MAHFAQIDDDGKVLQVIVISNEELLVKGEESEAKGIEFCKSLFGGNWIQTSYNSNIRKNYAGINFIYDKNLDAFIPPKCHEEAILNEKAQWDCNNLEHFPEKSI